MSDKILGIRDFHRLFTLGTRRWDEHSEERIERLLAHDAALRQQLSDTQAQAKRLAEALPSAEKLYYLADWLDLHDEKSEYRYYTKGEHLDQVQRDLRGWAALARQALAAYKEAQRKAIGIEEVTA